MHLLGHFLVPLLFFLGGSAFPDSLDATLYVHIKKCCAGATDFSKRILSYLSLRLLLRLHFRFAFLHSCKICSLFNSLCIGIQAGRQPEGFFGVVPIFAW
jgi:hypothetical protein